MEVPPAAPDVCPVCGAAYDSVSRHGDGLLINLRENGRYGRVCVDPVAADGEARVQFYHHTHEQTGPE